MIRSPFVALMVGIGHLPFIPMTGRFWNPDGLAYTHPMSKSYVTVAACDDAQSKAKAATKLERESAISASSIGCLGEHEEERNSYEAPMDCVRRDQVMNPI